MRSRLATLLLSTAILAALLATTSAARAPVARAHGHAELVTRYVGTPTAFAFSPRQVFMSDGTLYPRGIGGVYQLEHGIARRLPDSPLFAFGLTWHGHALFISAGNELLAWRGWDGQKFTRRHIIYTAPPGVAGFAGLAFGPHGRLYVGVEKPAMNHSGPASAPYRHEILSMTVHGTDVRIVAQGIRQPWQLGFIPGSTWPLVTDPGPKSGAHAAPDLLLRVRKGQDYGFPTCNWTRAVLCQGFARPIRFFPAHTDPMGLAIMGQRLYISEFGVRTRAQVISIAPGGGGPARVELSGFSPHRHIVGLGAHDGWIYVGETAASKRRFGSVWRFRP
jgi:glucose/arabinose dehydrogenase